MSASLKFLFTALNYLSLKGIPVDRVYTHSLRGGGSNALSIAGYSDRDMKKGGDVEVKPLRRGRNYIVLRRAC